jgi:hypothetical protein
VAIAAAGAIKADLVGVDLLPTSDHGYVALELNGAVDFTPEYSLENGDVFADVAEVLTQHLDVPPPVRRRAASDIA